MPNFKNANQVFQYLKGEGYQVSYNKIRADMDRGLLRPRKGKGFTLAAVHQYARTLPREGNDTPGMDAPVDRSEGASAAVKKLEAQSEELRIRIERQQLQLQREMGEVIPVEQVERELAARARVFRYSLENWIHGVVSKIASMAGADEQRAQKMIALVGGNEKRVRDLQAFCQRLEPELVELWRSEAQRLLNSFTTDEWWTVELQDFFMEYNRAGE